MTRGRKKDLTIPPTRALVQQRDYRARKAQYVSELEDRIRRAEEENAQLRKDLASARAGLAVPTVFNPEMVQTSAELMHNLNLASASLTRFQQIAFSINGQLPSVLTSAPTPSPSVGHTPPPTLPPLNANALRSSSFPSPAPSSVYSEPTHTPTSHTITDYSRPHHPPPRPDSPPGKRYFRSDSPPSRASPRAMTRSPSLDSESEHYSLQRMDYRDHLDSKESTSDPTALPRISILRTTSDDDDDPAAQFYSRRSATSMN